MRSGTLTQKSFRIICAFFPFKLKLLELLFDIQLGRDFTELILAYTIATNQKILIMTFNFVQNCLSLGYSQRNYNHLVVSHMPQQNETPL